MLALRTRLDADLARLQAPRAGVAEASPVAAAALEALRTLRAEPPVGPAVRHLQMATRTLLDLPASLFDELRRQRREELRAPR